MFSALILSARFVSLLAIATPSKLPTRCTGTISSLADVAQAVQCSTVNINGFTVPAGKSFNLNLMDGATVSLYGDILFGNMSWAGPLFQISGSSITFNGNGYSFDGGGPFYWDGKGASGGVQKPRPMMKIIMSGTFRDTNVMNSPAHCFSISNPGPLTITGVTIDNSQGDEPNAQSSGTPAAVNTDGFDCSTNDLTIEYSSVRNQDDCIAINEGSNVIFRNNTCTGGHGISVGSISSGISVSDVVISNNVVVDNDQALRIKTDAVSSRSIATNITYSGNTGSGLRRFGILIDQSYPHVLGSPGSGVTLSDINFVGATNTFSVDSSATPIAINCGNGSCQGAWDWSALTTSGGGANFFYNIRNVSGYNI